MTIKKRNELVVSFIPTLNRLSTRIKYRYREDAKQHALLELLKKANKWNSKNQSFKTFVYSRALGAMSDYVRKEVPYSRSKYNQLEFVDIELCRIESKAMDLINKRLYEEMLSFLPKEDRNIMRKYYEEGWYLKEIGKEIGMSIPYVYVRINSNIELIKERI